MPPPARCCSSPPACQPASRLFILTPARMGLFSNRRTTSSASRSAAASPTLAQAPPAQSVTSTIEARRLSTKKPARPQRPSARRSNNNKTGFPTSSQMIQGLGLRRSTSQTSHSSGSSFSCHGNMADQAWGFSGDEDAVEDDNRTTGPVARHVWDTNEPPSTKRYQAEDDGGREEIMDLTVSQLGGGGEDGFGVGNSSQASSSAHAQMSSFPFTATPRPTSQSTTYTPYSSLSSGSTPSHSSQASSVQTPTLESPHRGSSNAGYDWSFPYSTVSPIQSHELASGTVHVAGGEALSPFKPPARLSSKPLPTRPRASSRPLPPDPSLISQRNRSPSAASATTNASSSSSFFVPSASIASSRRPSRASGAPTETSSRKSSMKPSPRPGFAELGSTPATPTAESEGQLSVEADPDRSFSSVVDLYNISPVVSESLPAVPGTPLEPVWDAFLREADISPVHESAEFDGALAAVGAAAAPPSRPLPPPPSLLVEPSSSGDETNTPSHGGLSTSPLVLPAILPLRVNNPSPRPEHVAALPSISPACSISDLGEHVAALNFPRPPPVSHLPTRLRSIIPPPPLTAFRASSSSSMSGGRPDASPSTSSFRSRFSGSSSTTCDSPSPLTPSFPPPMPGDGLLALYRMPTSPASSSSIVGEDDMTVTFPPLPPTPVEIVDSDDVSARDSLDLEALARIKWSSGAVLTDNGETGEDPEQTVRAVRGGRKRRGLIGEAM